MRLHLMAAIALLTMATPVIADAQELVSSAALSGIYNNASIPAFGNAGGVVIVEFFDYQCSYCKASEAGVQKILQENSNLEIIYVDFPKLGPMSFLAAKAALAAWRQGADKYLLFHNRLMEKNTHASEELIFQAAAQVGLDAERLKKDMNDPIIARQIQSNIALGHSVGVKVTPDFIVGGRFYPGYATYEQLKERIAYAQSSGGLR